MENKLIILGNGFTIDFIEFLKLQDKIDVKNLFRLGDKVPWPGDDSAGFLSFKHCPNLWNLGARTNLDNKTTLEIIEDIITCANIF